MAELQPLRGLHYDRRRVPDLSAVICPPYDIIGDDERRRLAARDPHNAVHVELPVAEVDAADGYDRAGRLFAEWRAAGVLALDEAPAIYVYQQRYSVVGAGGGDGSRAAGVCRGFFCRLRLEQPGTGVRRHEQTMPGPKEDRLRLLRAVRANLSPVLLLYDDGAAGQRSAELVERLVAGEPRAEATDEAGTVHRLWRVSADEPSAAELLTRAAARPLTIADGHHRYETALRYRDEPRAPQGAAWVMALLYDAASGGLTVLPTHRLLHRMGETESLVAAVDELFTRVPVPDGAALLAALQDGAPGVIGLWTRHGGGLLRARREAIAPLLPATRSAALRGLDVVVLGTALERMLGLDAAALAEEGRLSYTKDAVDALAQVDENGADACFLVPPTPVAAVMEVAAAGETMPPKSTYFVPKAATGLVFNPLD